ncbi:hypothetical protein [Flavobacterium sp. 2]|uniref:hypothetical protein n=1 Tax=Flavobacterium sp. 2 TaxID=308053 RepID=UPI003CF12B92
MNTIFFDTRNYLIDKKRKSSGNQVRIYNDRRECIGFIAQGKTALQKNKGLNIFSAVFEIRNADGVLKVSLSRCRPIFCSKIIIKDADGKKVGSIEQQFSFFKRNLKVLNASNEVIAVIYGNKKNLCFTIVNISENEIGEIKRREDSIRSSGTYDIIIDEICTSFEDKIAILSSALAINMVF